ncbi:MAG: toxin HipA [Candidatus Aminicenantes bacterium]|nr:toxin HipA [Candidatus Aminicenantes bacterium]NIM81627.1 toxin HipA [Candidatus Aminicenantes bacterium]NIN20997.1 toxin HipA [Candidatus Aminicenantes bacterium]NIN44818.1 toxin HipA [Candidatus Aminicenantes bacterium]NIN87626.1 toxin HipA [Candidatus Aminicenantes bacterium]
MRKAEVSMHGVKAGVLEEIEKEKKYIFTYDDEYTGDPISLTMPLQNKRYEFDLFPPVFEGLLPEGIQLEGLLRINKIDAHDFFSQLVSVGGDMVGAVTVKEV